VRHSRAAGGQRAPFEALLPSDDLFVDPIVKTDVLPAPGRARSTVRARRQRADDDAAGARAEVQDRRREAAPFEALPPIDDLSLI